MVMKPEATTTPDAKPLVVITGAAGGIGTALTHYLRDRYRIVGLDIKLSEEADASYEFDLTSPDSVKQVIRQISEDHGENIAAVVHLAAYFDFSGEHSPLYEKVNVEGTRNLLEALHEVKVERFIYSGTMLVHRPGKPGEKIDEQTAFDPRWIYPQSKADTEAVIREQAGDMPYTVLRLAGLYDENNCVPTLAHQIARIYEHDLKSHVYAGPTDVGQACIHKDDMMDAFRRTIDRRQQLPKKNAILIGEEQSDSYERLQNRLGELIHGEEHWTTLSVPKSIAKAGAFVEEKTEPLVPDDFDKGEKPFIRPFMVDLANDHYALDISRAREQLGWEPKHKLYDELPNIVKNLKKDPKTWYKKNGITPPDWVGEADERGENPEAVLEQYQQQYTQQHAQNLWAHFVNMALGLWLITSPLLMGYSDTGLAYSDWGTGLLVMIFASLSLSWRQSWARWVCAGLGLWVLFAPLAFNTQSPAAYLNGTLVGMLIIGLAAAIGPAPGVSPAAAVSGPTTPPGWDNNPSSWLQRMPIIALALIGFFLSRYMAAFQLGHIDGLWDPFFPGVGAEGENGAEAVTGSELSESFPVSDAGMGGIVYALEILIGLIGTTQRWRTMPWLVASFGILIVPLGVISITFIIIQPILIGTWCAPCLLAAALMLIQIAYAFNEFVATGEFLYRRKKAGAPLLKIFFAGDVDEGPSESTAENWQRNSTGIIKDALVTGVSVPWNLAVAAVVGLWLMFTRITLGNEGGMANWDHLVGALIVTVAVIAMAETARPVRWVMIPIALPLLITPFIYGVGLAAIVSSVVCALALMALSVPRGSITGHYGCWSRVLR